MPFRVVAFRYLTVLWKWDVNSAAWRRCFGHRDRQDGQSVIEEKGKGSELSGACEVWEEKNKPVKVTS